MPIEAFEKIDTHPPYLGDRPIPGLLYADDMVIISLTPVGLQRALNELARYCDEWKLKVNVKKTKIMVFQNGNKRSKKYQWFINNSAIEEVDKFTYLGIVVNKNGTWKTHQKVMACKAEAASRTIRTARNKYSEIPIKLQNQMFDTLVQPIVLYGAEVWGDKCDESIVNRVGIAHSKRLLGVGHSTANCGAMLEAGRVLTSTIVAERMIIFWLKLRNDENKKLQLDCLKTQDNDFQKENWLKGLKRYIHEIDMDYLLDGADIDSATIRKIKRKGREVCFNKLREQAESMKSL